MKKGMILALVAFMFTGTQLYAGNGNLIVNGSLGVGTTTPTTTLAVVGSISATGSAGYNTFGTGTFIGGDGGDGLIYAMNNATWAPLYIDASALYLNAQTGGNVGIGTTTPGAYKLYVNGSAYTTDTVWHTSDARYKKNILPVQNALTTLLQINGVSYEWKKPVEYMNANDYSALVAWQNAGGMAGLPVDGNGTRVKIPETKNFPDGRQYGVIAQAIETVLPEVVKTDSNGDKAVNYSGIIPILIEAVKEQQTMITQLQKQLADIQQNLQNNSQKSQTPQTSQ